MSAVKHLKNSNEKGHFLVGRTAPQRFESLSGDPDRRATSTSPQITSQTPSFIGTFNIEKTIPDVTESTCGTSRSLLPAGWLNTSAFGISTHIRARTRSISLLILHPMTALHFLR